MGSLEDFGDWARTIEDTITALSDSAEPGVVAQAHQDLAGILSGEGQQAAAATHFAQAAEHWDRANSPTRAAAAYFEASRNYYVLDRVSDAVSSLREAARRLLVSGDRQQWLLMSQAVIDGLIQGDAWDDLRKWADEIAVDAARETDPDSQLLTLRCHYHGAFACMRTLAWSGLIAHADQGLDLAKRLHPATAAELLFMSATAHQHLGAEDAALRASDAGTDVVVRDRLVDLGELAVIAYGDLLPYEAHGVGERLGRLEAWLRSVDSRKAAVHAAYYRALAQAESRPVDTVAAADALVAAADEAKSVGLDKESGLALLRASGLVAVIAHQSDATRALAIEAGIRGSEQLGSIGDWWGAAIAANHVAFAMRPLRFGAADDRDPRLAQYQIRAARCFRRAGRPQEAAGTWAGAAMSWRAEHGTVRLLRIVRLALATFEAGRTAVDLPRERRGQREQVGPGLLSLPAKLLEALAAGADRDEVGHLLWCCEEAAKGRAFADALASAPNEGEPEVGEMAALSREVNVLEGHWRRLDESLERLLATSANPSQVEGLMQQRDEAKLAHDEAELKLSRRLLLSRPTSRPHVGSGPLTPVDVAAVLDEAEAYVGFLQPMMGSSLVVLTVTHQHGMSFEILPQPPSSAIDRIGGHLLECDPGHLAEDADVHNESVALWTSLFGTLPPAIRTVLVAPHGHLGRYPFSVAALRHSSVPLAVGLVPSATCAVLLRRQKRAVRDLDYLGLAADGDGRAPRVKDEVLDVLDRHFDATRARAVVETGRATLLALDSRVGLLHLACHADRNGLLVGSPGEWVSPVELSGLRLRADILLLTGCHAGLLVFDDASEFGGVVRELLVATGARAAVASRTAVPDPAGPIFADLFTMAMTGRARDGFEGPDRALPVAEAVAWATAAMRQMPAASLASLLRPPVGIVEPSWPEWWSPWLVIGDPATVPRRDEEAEQ